MAISNKTNKADVIKAKDCFLGSSFRYSSWTSASKPFSSSEIS